MGKKQKCPEFENHERWLVSFADMLTLLFAVFVVLFALKEGGEPQVQKTAGSMQESFNTPLDDIPVDRKAGPMQQGFGIFEHFKGNSALPPLANKYPATKRKISIIDDEMNKLSAELEDRLYGPNKFREGGKDGHSRIVEVYRTRNGFNIRLLARHFYDVGQIKVKASTRKTLDQVIKMVKNLGRDVRIEGHADSYSGGKKYDAWDISALRATHMVKYMISKHQFPQTRLSATGLGDIKPVAHNGTESGRQLNRRIEIHISYDTEGQGDTL